MRFWRRDFEFALRQLRKSPVFAITAVMTLGLGIGVCAAMFSVIEQVILRPLPYPNQSRLVTMRWVKKNGSDSDASFSLPDLRDYRARSHALAGIAGYTFQIPTLGGTKNPQLVPQLMVTRNLLEVLGVHLHLGRGFTKEDTKAGHTHVVILGDGVWRKFYHADEKIIGRSVPIDGVPYTVVGVLPPGVEFPMGVGQEIVSPLNLDEKDLQNRADRMLTVIALLRPGVSVAEAQGEVAGIHAQVLHEYPHDEFPASLRLVDYRSSITQHSRSALFALDWAVLAVWLIACANVAGLMLTRNASRRREIAIRGALGAPRGRITQQFLMESLLLALTGSGVGMGIAGLALHLLRHYFSDQLLFGKDIHIDAGVVGFLLLASCFSALLFGLAPAWHASGVPAQEGLREGSIAAGTSRGQMLWRDGLVVGEIALTLALLIAAGLMMRTLLSLRRAHLGFVTGNVVTGSLYMPTHGPWWNFSGEPKNATNLVQSFYDPLQQKLRHIPGVAAAGFTTVRPLDPNWRFNDSVRVKGRPKPPANEAVHAQVRATTTGYFKAMGIPLLAGRYFGDLDGPASPVAVVVNKKFVQEQFPRENPLGQQVEIGRKGNPRRWGTIVGVVGNAKQDSPGQPAVPEMDVNLEQLQPSDSFYPVLVTLHMNLAVRARMAPKLMENTIRRDIHALAPEAAVQNLEPMQQVVNDALGSQTLAARLLGIFALAALLIALAGIYGLLAYSVSQRTRELGVRITLGAQREDIVWLILRHALILLAMGGGMGLAVAWAASGVMHSYLYGARGWDAATVMLVVTVLGLCGVAASYVPARRAAGVDPMEALRNE